MLSLSQQRLLVSAELPVANHVHLHVRIVLRIEPVTVDNLDVQVTFQLSRHVACLVMRQFENRKLFEDNQLGNGPCVVLTLFTTKGKAKLT